MPTFMRISPRVGVMKLEYWSIGVMENWSDGVMEKRIQKTGNGIQQNSSEARIQNPEPVLSLICPSVFPLLQHSSTPILRLLSPILQYSNTPSFLLFLQLYQLHPVIRFRVLGGGAFRQNHKVSLDLVCFEPLLDICVPVLGVIFFMHRMHAI